MKSIKINQYWKDHYQENHWWVIDGRGIHVFDLNNYDLLVPFSSIKKARIASNNTLFVHLYTNMRSEVNGPVNYLEMRFPSQDKAEEIFNIINSRIGTKYELKRRFKNIIATVAIILFLVCVIGSISQCSGNSSTGDTRTCRVCHRKYEAGTAGNSSIARTGMCENCYSNYEFGEQVREAAETYRNGKY